jgi:hypothetical protein
MDPKYPFKICLYPSIKSNSNSLEGSVDFQYEELEQLILYNYLLLKRDCELDL